MEWISVLGDFLETVQNQGGLMFVGILALWYIRKVDVTSKDRDYDHMLFYHHTDLKQKKEN
jgi:hypothetical protein